MARRKTASVADAGGAIRIGDTEAPPGKRTDIELRAARLPTGTWASLPVTVVRGLRDGPRVWLSAALHGDEINGIEIIRRVLVRLKPRAMSGAVIAAPIVNVFGFLQQSRYLPDRRDLNRSFPGSARGSLAARLAHLFLNEIVEPCTHGIDLHTGSHYRTNYPQIRADLDDPETHRLATAFGAPVMIDAKLRDGSLRAAAVARGKRVLLYEAGEPLRFDRDSIRTGVRGVMSVLAALGMVEDGNRRIVESWRAKQTTWVRARRAGLLVLEVALGEHVAEGSSVGFVTDAFGGTPSTIPAPVSGTVLGLSTNPIVHRGDAIVHIAHAADSGPTS